jgi:carbon monoxide dehydrogenase subunit G
MKLEQSFEVAAPLERVWEALIDVQRVAPCLPGASVTGKNDDGSYNGEFKVKIGPTSAAYSGKLNMETVDVEGHSATMQASGTDRRGQGGAKATIVSSVAPAGDGQTRVDVSTDYHITGRLARFGRGGMIEEISNRLLGDFAKNLQAMLVGGEQEPAAADTPPAEAPPTEATVAAAAAAPAEDPDAAIGGATPVAPAAEEPANEEPANEEPSAVQPAAEEPSVEQPPAPPTEQPPAPPTEEPVAPPPPPPPGPTPPPPPGPTPLPTSETEPISAVSLIGSVAIKRAKENPAPLAALMIGFLAALRLLRRRS